jgi:hypothetical protein
MKKMRKNKKVIMGTLLLAAVFMSLSCASSLNLKSNWRSSVYKGPAYKKIMVVAMTKLVGLRQSMEDEFAQQLRSQGVEVATCHEFIPDPGKASQEELVRVGQGMGTEAYLILRLLGTGTEGHDSAQGYSFNRVYGFWYANPVVMTKWSEVARLESMIYDGKTSELVWRATVDVVDPSGSEGQISRFVSLIVKTLSEDKMIPSS